MRTIVVVPYDPNWPAQFQQEAKTLAAVFGDALVSIHHIGSTAVPGLSAKPIIDIMPLVRAIEQVNAFDSAMEQLGYRAMGENGIPGRRYFRKGSNENRTHQVHTFAVGHPEVVRHLAFRDYLIAHPAVAATYARLKIGLAQQFPHDIQAYMDGKDGFIKETERKAMAWRTARPQKGTVP